jgi:hypothetical protein
VTGSIFSDSPDQEIVGFDFVSKLTTTPHLPGLADSLGGSEFGRVSKLLADDGAPIPDEPNLWSEDRVTGSL